MEEIYSVAPKIKRKRNTGKTIVVIFLKFSFFLIKLKPERVIIDININNSVYNLYWLKKLFSMASQKEWLNPRIEFLLKNTNKGNINNPTVAILINILGSFLFKKTKTKYNPIT